MPNMLPWSVSASPGMPSARALSTSPGTDERPSSREYCVCTWRWTKGIIADCLYGVRSDNTVWDGNLLYYIRRDMYLCWWLSKISRLQNYKKIPDSSSGSYWHFPDRCPKPAYRAFPRLIVFCLRHGVTIATLAILPILSTRPLSKKMQPVIGRDSGGCASL